MATTLNSKIIELAKKNRSPVRFSFCEGNRNVVSVDNERFYHVRPATFHRDMKDAGFQIHRVNNPFYTLKDTAACFAKA